MRPIDLAQKTSISFYIELNLPVYLFSGNKWQDRMIFATTSELYLTSLGQPDKSVDNVAMPTVVKHLGKDTIDVHRDPGMRILE